jgi:hypothetical protein
MNPAFDQIIAAADEERAGLFTATAQRLGSTPKNAEKDFWVCWVLDALFNGRPDSAPRLLFKGGTSLSKGFGLIKRFSEDIDVTVFRDDIGEPVSVADLWAMSGKKRRAALDAIEAAGAAYIQGELREALQAIIAQAAARTGVAAERFELQTAPDDAQTLLLSYPSATPADDYVRSTVKIESGAKSALDPHTTRTIRPYVDDDAPGLDLSVANVVTVDAERTFWDKVVILHGLRRWYDRRAALRGGGQRISRHYYDLYMLMRDAVGQAAVADAALGADCVAHARMFFDRPDFDLASAQPPTFALSPDGPMYDDLRRDYALMRPMIFGEAPSFETVLENVFTLERRLNGRD